MMKKRALYLLLLSALFVLYIFLVDYLSFFVLVFFAVLPVISLLLSLWAMRGLCVTLWPNAVSVRKNQPFSLCVKAQSKSFLPSGRVKLRLSVKNEMLLEETGVKLFLTACKQGTVVEHTLSSGRCGRLSCTAERIWVCDYLGLFSVPIRTKPGQSAKVFVLPQVHTLTMELDQRTAQDEQSDEYSPTKPGDDPSELFDIREYRDGDKLSRVHWKLSSKLDNIMVKEGGLPLSHNVRILCELNGEGAEIDVLLDTLSSLSYYLLENRLSHKIDWYDGKNSRVHSTRVAQEDDLTALLGAVLSVGRPQEAPMVLKNCRSQAEVGTSRVLYLCAGLSEASIRSLFDSFPHSRIAILQVQAAPAYKVGAAALSMGIEHRVVLPGQIEKSLEGFSI